MFLRPSFCLYSMLQKRSFLSAAAAVLVAMLSAAAAAGDQPNVLWITAEDHGPHLGTYGDTYAHTPNMDSLAARGFRYDLAWSTAPVCAPARTTIITGLYATSFGGQHMRSDVQLPAALPRFPQLLRKEGYYCTNNAKEDYNVSGGGEIWDESSRAAHYRNRTDNQPFFAVFNFSDSHESRIRDRTDLPHHNPAQAPIPPYHPDTPEVRRDWAQYYHGVSNADARAGKILQELEEAGLAGETIVFFYADHGSGMPRHKRWPYNSGLQIPLIVHIPEKFRHLAPAEYAPGGHTRRPVGFVDLAPTVLSLAGIEAPDWMQGRPFLGPDNGEPQIYLFGFSGRMDESSDMVRSVRDGRYIYLRNYMPHLIYGQFLAYMFETETTRIWQRLYHEGKLTGPQTAFWEPKPAEELYDLQNDPHETVNLIASPDHQDVLAKLRKAHREHVLGIRDAGFLPEAEMHRRAGDASIYEMTRNENRYPLERIFETAQLAADRDRESTRALIAAFADPDPAVRYWAAMGILIRGKTAYEATAREVRAGLDDENPSVRIAAADILVQYGTKAEIDDAVKTLAALAPPDVNGAYVGLAAMRVIARLDQKNLARLKPMLANMILQDPQAPKRANDYVRRHVAAILDRPGSRGRHQLKGALDDEADKNPAGDVPGVGLFLP